MTGSTSNGHVGCGRWFNIGDRVQWSSQSLGAARTKVGTIIAIVPPDELPSRFIPSEYRLRHKMWTPYLTRGHESYIVVGYKVGVGGDRVGRKWVVLYWPMVKNLKLAVNPNMEDSDDGSRQRNVLCDQEGH
jgi:hypothetical protein